MIAEEAEGKNERGVDPTTPQFVVSLKLGLTLTTSFPQ